jgi:hypothetical protein
MKKRLIFDTANILFRVSAAHSKYHTDDSQSPEVKAGLAMHMALNSFNKYYKAFKPDEIALTFEGSKNWRKAYTKSSDCVSKKVYKANRTRDPSMEPFFELMKSFEDLAKNHTSLVCLSNEHLEGDDLFGGYVEMCTAAGDEVIGVSGDKDFVQLLKYKNFSLIDPDKGKPRTVESVCGVDDPEFFMFEKAFRGDKNDNVFPAYPNVRKKRLQKCFQDEYELTQILNESWNLDDPENGETLTFKVGDLYHENQLLMNLNMQPDHIKKIIAETITHQVANTGKFSHFHFVKFCGKYGLKQIAENSTQFAAMLSTKIKVNENKNVEESIIQF